jgi:SpoVK/Ycf46/Vps4 family AAA+-type ATPase
MTSLAQVTALVDAHVSRDHARFRAIALSIAANVAARSERGADQLRRLVDRQEAVAFVPLPSASGLLSAPSDLSTLDDMVLAPVVRSRLDGVLLEHSRKLDLRASGLDPARKLLFCGPPGCGKTMAAGALARSLGLPMFRVDLHGVIGSHLGETAGKLAKVFEHVATMPAVYLFDEFDAIGSARGSLGGEAAGAEMRRVVNSLLQFVEDDRSDSLIVAATNHAQALDPAIFRRFDETVVFPAPSSVEIIELIEQTLELNCLDYDAICEAWPDGLGHADLVAALVRVRKAHVLAGSPIDTRAVVEAVRLRARATVEETS